MKLKFIIILGLISFCGCNAILTCIIRCSPPQKVDWTYIQNHGGIQIGELNQNNEGYWLPIECNAAGLKTITIKPKDFTSYPIYYVGCSLKYRSDTIFITLKKKIDDRIKKDITQIKLKGFPVKGIKTYKLFYKNPDKSVLYLQEIIIN